MAIAKLSLYDSVAKRFLFGPKKRKRALRKLATYVEENIQISDALIQMSRFASHDGRKPNDFTSKVFRRWASRVAGGVPPSEAMSGYLPELERQVIVAADKYGRLGQGIREALEIREGIDEIRGAMRSALIYPIILLVGVTAYFIYMAAYILPSWHDALPIEQWPGTASNLEATSNFVYHNIATIYATIILLTFVVGWLMPRWTGPIRAKADDYLPFSVYRTLYGTIFLMSLSGYVKAGMNVPNILDQMLKTAQPWYAERLRAILRQVRGGRNIGDALDAIGYKFPDREVIEDLRVFTRHKGFDATLKTMGKEILAESTQKIRTQSVIVRNIAIGAMGGLMFWFTNALFDYQNAVSHAATMNH